MTSNFPDDTKETIFRREAIREKEAAPMKLLTTLEAVNDFSQRDHCESSATGENVKGTLEPL
ncbi:hypothetical protein SD469_003627 [Vibrio cholerae]|nr:hypothetical protein [Vibrio cholerae]